MMTHMASDTQAMTSSVICGQVLLFGAQAGSPFRGGSALVALKIVKTAASMESTMSEQLKLTPLSTNLAIRTRVLIFCSSGQRSSARRCLGQHLPDPVLAP